MQASEDERHPDTSKRQGRRAVMGYGICYPQYLRYAEHGADDDLRIAYVELADDSQYDLACDLMDCMAAFCEKVGGKSSEICVIAADVTCIVKEGTREHAFLRASGFGDLDAEALSGECGWEHVSSAALYKMDELIAHNLEVSCEILADASDALPQGRDAASGALGGNAPSQEGRAPCALGAISASQILHGGVRRPSGLRVAATGRAAWRMMQARRARSKRDALPSRPARPARRQRHQSLSDETREMLGIL